jgi:cytochrome c-type biogenesis protein CcmI
MILEFWMPALGLFVAVAVVLLRALTAPVEGAEVLDGDARIYRDQLDEVARDIAKGAVSPEDGARMRAEVARRLLQADKAREHNRRWRGSGLWLRSWACSSPGLWPMCSGSALRAILICP